MPDTARPAGQLETANLHRRVGAVVAGDFVAKAAEVFVDFVGARQGGADMGQDILRADMLDEVRLLEQPRRLVARAAKQQHFPCLVYAFGEDFDGVQSGAIDGGHVAQTQDDHLIEAPEIGGLLRQRRCV